MQAYSVWRSVLVLVCVLGVAVSLATDNGRRYALLIGINDYEYLGKLDNAREDAEALAEVLVQNCGFDPDRLCLITDNPSRPKEFQPTFTNLKRRLQYFTQTPGAGDSVLLYFAGHGVTYGNGGCLMPIDGSDEDSGLAMNWVRSQLENCSAKSKILIMDACHSGKQTRGVSGIAPTLNGTSNVLVLAACKENEISYPEGKHGVFTAALLDGFGGKADTNQDRTITAKEIYGFVRDYIDKWSVRTGKTQMPQMTPGSAFEVAIAKVSPRPAGTPIPAWALTAATAEPPANPNTSVTPATPEAMTVQDAFGTPGKTKVPTVNQTVTLSWALDPTADKQRPSSAQIFDSAGNVVGEICLAGNRAAFGACPTATLKHTGEDKSKETSICEFRMDDPVGQIRAGKAGNLSFAGRVTEIKRGMNQSNGPTLELLTIEVDVSASAPPSALARMKQSGPAADRTGTNSKSPARDTPETPVNQTVNLSVAYYSSQPKSYPARSQVLDTEGNVVGEVGLVYTRGKTAPFVFYDPQNKENPLCEFRIDDAVGQRRMAKAAGMSLSTRVTEITRDGVDILTLTVEVTARRPAVRGESPSPTADIRPAGVNAGSTVKNSTKPTRPAAPTVRELTKSAKPATSTVKELTKSARSATDH